MKKFLFVFFIMLLFSFKLYPMPKPIAEYRFDECKWTGASNEVEDSSGNGFNGTASDNITTSNGKLCQSGDFSTDSITDYIILPSGVADGLDNFTISVWIKTSNPDYQSILSGANFSQDNELLMWISGNNIQPWIKGHHGSINFGNSIADNQWHHIVWTRVGENNENCIYLDGNLEGCYTLSSYSGPINIDSLIVGQEQDNVGDDFNKNQDFQGYIDELKFFNKVLTQQEIQAIYDNESQGKNYDGTQRKCNICKEKKLEWRFDECSWDDNQPIIDYSGNNLKGMAFGNATISTDGHLCKAGYFDGDGDYVSGGNILNDVFNKPNNKFTITAWIKPTELNDPNPTNHNTRNTFIAKASDNYNDTLEIGVNNNGTLHVYIDTGNADANVNDYYDFGSSGSIPINQWTFIAVVFDNGNVTAYINGDNYTRTWPNNTIAPGANGSPFTVGASLHVDNFFHGYIDEVKVFSDVLTEEEINRIYNETRDKCPFCGLVGEWRFDGCYDNYTGEIKDFSGKNNNGTVKGSLYSETGKICNGGNFDGQTYVEIPDSDLLKPTNGFSVSLWFKAHHIDNNSWHGIITKLTNVNPPHIGKGWNININHEQITALISRDNGSATYLYSHVNADNNTWYHVALVYSSDNKSTKLYINGELKAQRNNFEIGSTDNPLQIGKFYTDSQSLKFFGTIDEVKIFKRPLTSQEISDIYNSEKNGYTWNGEKRDCAVCVKPKAEYRFDECGWNGIPGEVKDSTGNGFDGTAYNTNTSVDSQICQSADFTDNSTSDYILIPSEVLDGAQNFTVSVWFKTESSSQQSIISGASQTGSPANQFLIFLRNPTRIWVFINNSYKAFDVSNLADNNWHNLTLTRTWNSQSGDNNCLYLDGNLVDCKNITDNSSANRTLNIKSLVIGQEMDYIGATFDAEQDFEGYIDELKIFDTNLTAEQIKSIYLREKEKINYDGTVRNCEICEGLVLNWRFDECIWRDNNKDAIDYSGHGNNGTIHKATTDEDGHMCRAGKFNNPSGISDDNMSYVSGGNILNDVICSDLKKVTSFTVTAWIKPKTLNDQRVSNHNTYNTFLAKASQDYTSTYNDTIELGVNPDGTLHVYIDTGKQNAKKSEYKDFGYPGIIQTNRWNFVGVTFNKGIVDVYINDEHYTATWPKDDPNSTFTYIATNCKGSPFTVGISLHHKSNNQNNPLSSFNGLIDEVKVYDKVLNSNEIEKIKEETRKYCKICPKLLGEWKLNECVYDGTSGEVKDTSGNGNNGTTYNIDNTTEAVVCNGAYFDGSGYINIPNSTSLNPQNGFTVALWFNSDNISYGSWNGILTKLLDVNYQTGRGFNINLNHGKITALISDQNGLATYLNSNVIANENTWYHVALVHYNDNKTEIYVNGELKNTTNHGIGFTNNPLQIGKFYTNNNGLKFYGIIDEVKIFDAPLKPEDIQSIYQNERNGYNWDGGLPYCISCNTAWAEYRFDECAWYGNSGEVKDSSPNVFNGSATNGLTTKDTGYLCRAADFKNNNQSVDINLNNDYTFDSFTISVWIKTDVQNSQQTIISGSGQSSSFSMRFSNDRFYPYLNNTTISPPLGLPNIADNVWHHLIWTWNGGDNCIYVDGVKRGCGTINVNTITISSLKIGGNFVGNMDELKIFKRVLSESEINQLYLNEKMGLNWNGSERICNSCSELILDWRFDECSGATKINDYSGNNNSGTFYINAKTEFGGVLCRSGYFDGQSYVQLDNTSAMDGVLCTTDSNNPVKAFTVTAWVKPTYLNPDNHSNHGTYNTFLAKASDNYNDTIELGINPNGGLHVYIDTGGGDATSPDYRDFGFIPLNQWTFVAVVFNNGKVNVFINDSKYTATWPDNYIADNCNLSPFTIGTTRHVINYFTGYVDEVKVFKGVLSDKDIEQIYNNEKYGKNYNGT